MTAYNAVVILGQDFDLKLPSVSGDDGPVSEEVAFRYWHMFLFLYLSDELLLGPSALKLALRENTVETRSECQTTCRYILQLTSEMAQTTNFDYTLFKFGRDKTEVTNGQSVLKPAYVVGVNPGNGFYPPGMRGWNYEAWMQQYAFVRAQNRGCAVGLAHRFDGFIGFDPCVVALPLQTAIVPALQDHLLDRVEAHTNNTNKMGMTVSPLLLWCIMYGGEDTSTVAEFFFDRVQYKGWRLSDRSHQRKAWKEMFAILRQLDDFHSSSRDPDDEARNAMWLVFCLFLCEAESQNSGYAFQMLSTTIHSVYLGDNTDLVDKYFPLFVRRYKAGRFEGHEFETLHCTVKKHHFNEFIDAMFTDFSIPRRTRAYLLASFVHCPRHTPAITLPTAKPEAVKMMRGRSFKSNDAHQWWIHAWACACPKETNTKLLQETRVRVMAGVIKNPHMKPVVPEDVFLDKLVSGALCGGKCYQQRAAAEDARQRRSLVHQYDEDLITGPEWHDPQCHIQGVNPRKLQPAQSSADYLFNGVPCYGKEAYNVPLLFLQILDEQERRWLGLESGKRQGAIWDNYDSGATATQALCMPCTLPGWPADKFHHLPLFIPEPDQKRTDDDWDRLIRVLYLPPLTVLPPAEENGCVCYANSPEVDVRLMDESSPATQRDLHLYTKIRMRDGPKPRQLWCELHCPDVPTGISHAKLNIT